MRRRAAWTKAGMAMGKLLRPRALAVGGMLFVLAVGWVLGVGAQTRSERPGDFNGNGRIDSDDLFEFGYYFGFQRGDPLYAEEGHRADFDHNGCVDELDLFYFASHWHRD